MTLNRSQRVIAKRVLELTRDDGFVLVGGLALLELGVTTRPTEDLDAFSNRASDVGVIAGRVAETLRTEGYSVAIDRSSESFARFVVTTGRYRQSALKIELGFDTMLFPVVETALGDCATIRELGANKMLAAFARHQPRDLSDIYDLASLVSLHQMLNDAQQKDHGFNGEILAEMILRTVQIPDELWPITTDVLAVRTFMTNLAQSLVNRNELPSVPPREPPVPAYHRADGTIVRGYRRSRSRVPGHGLGDVGRFQ
jgi:Nucleotidyl transferase AbiEii toxin, Type IV TA system